MVKVPGVRSMHVTAGRRVRHRSEEADTRIAADRTERAPRRCAAQQTNRIPALAVLLVAFALQS